MNNIGTGGYGGLDYNKFADVDWSKESSLIEFVIDSVEVPFFVRDYSFDFYVKNSFIPFTIHNQNINFSIKVEQIDFIDGGESTLFPCKIQIDEDLAVVFNQIVTSQKVRTVTEIYVKDEGYIDNPMDAIESINNKIITLDSNLNGKVIDITYQY
jgi:hypothetical protein